MKQVDTISVGELTKLAERMYGDLVKAVVDIEKELLVIDVEMHVDAEEFLLQNGSKQADLWGINFYPGKFGSEDFIEFDSMINIRPSQNNRSRGVQDVSIQNKIREIVLKKIKK